jgi:hypothetical protein
MSIYSLICSSIVWRNTTLSLTLVAVLLSYYRNMLKRRTNKMKRHRQTSEGAVVIDFSSFIMENITEKSL